MQQSENDGGADGSTKGTRTLEEKKVKRLGIKRKDEPFSFKSLAELDAQEMRSKCWSRENDRVA